MKTIEYRVTYSGVIERGSFGISGEVSSETIRVQARNINSGFTKALKIANQPLGNGSVREIGTITFWQVV